MTSRAALPGGREREPERDKGRVVPVTHGHVQLDAGGDIIAVPCTNPDCPMQLERDGSANDD